MKVAWAFGHRDRAAEERIRALKARAAVAAHHGQAIEDDSRGSGRRKTNQGSTIRTAEPLAGDAGADARGHGMPNIEDFMDEVVAEYRRRLALLGDSGDRRAVEDGIALLTDYRLSDMDVAHFEKLLSMLRAGRSPVGLAVLRPEAIGADLSRRWQEYGAVSAAN